MLTRSDILSEAIHKCLVEMYKWAQPAIDLDKLIADGVVVDAIICDLPYIDYPKIL